MGTTILPRDDDCLWVRHERERVRTGRHDQSLPETEAEPVILLLALLLLLLAVGGGIVVSKLLFLLLVVAAVLFLLDVFNRRSV